MIINRMSCDEWYEYSIGTHRDFRRVFSFMFGGSKIIKILSITIQVEKQKKLDKLWGILPRQKYVKTEKNKFRINRCRLLTAC